MIVDTLLLDTKAYWRNQIVGCSIAVENGLIFKIGKETQMPSADERVNLNGLVVLPGLIDAHTHLRDEGKSYKEDFYTGTAAAAAGGMTTVLDMPNNSPVTMSAQTLKNRMDIAKGKVLVDVGFFSEFPEETAEIKEIVSQGAIGFKLFMGAQVGGLDLDDDGAIEAALETVSQQNVPVAVHAEDKALIKKAETAFKAANRSDLNAFLRVHSEAVETVAIEHLLRVSKGVDLHLHFCHLTNEQSLNVFIDAKKNGRKVSGEVTPQHLFLSVADFERQGSLLVMVPPLRDVGNVEALWKAISDGWVDTVGSDHAPHTLNEKSFANVWDVKLGVPGLETTLPLLFTKVKKNQISLGNIVQLLAERPAKIFGLRDRGRLEEGLKADMIVLDFDQKFRVDASKFQSKAKFSPFNGQEVQGKIVKTFVGGELVKDDFGIVARAGSGRVIRRETL